MQERSGIITFKGNPFTLLGTELKVGAKAPDFKVVDNSLAPVTLATYSGRIKVISAVPSLDTPVCDTETRRFNQEAAGFPDNVVVLTGKDKGRTGKVLKVLPTENRVVVQGVNMVQRHTRPTQADPQGGIKNKEASLHLSNVAIADSNGKATRVGFRVDGDKKVRFAKTTGDVI